MEYPLIDDIGSFPLPSYISPDYFKKFYWDAYQGIINGYNIFQNKGLKVNVIHPIEETFKLKIDTGLDIINYPQLMDIYSQFLHPMENFEMEHEPHLIEETKAKIIEVDILKQWAKKQYNEGLIDKPINLKICVTGPLELYFKKVGFEIYKDMALNFSESVHSFLKNSIIDTKYIKTTSVSIDEPSLGYVTTTNSNEDDMIKIYDHSTRDLDVDIQIHLHSLNSFKIPLQTKNINVLTCEFASNQQNKINKKYLEEYDKFMRVGITRTNINAIMAQSIENGTSFKELSTIEGLMTLIDSEKRINKNLDLATKHYGERLKFVGPDCGLSAWGPPKVALELLQRTCKVVKNFQK